MAETKLVHEYAVRQLLRIGYDELPGHLDGGMDAWVRAGLPVEEVAKLTEYRVATSWLLRNRGSSSGCFFPRCKMETPWAEFAFGVDVSDTYERKRQVLAAHTSIFQTEGDRLLALYEAETGTTGV